MTLGKVARVMVGEGVTRMLSVANCNATRKANVHLQGGEHTDPTSNKDLKGTWRIASHLGF